MATIVSYTKAFLEAALSDAKGIVFARKVTHHTLVLGDAGSWIEMNVAVANNLTVPANADVAFPLKTRIKVSQYGAGQTTIVPDADVTLRSVSGALDISGQYGVCTLVKVGTDEWYVYGNLS